MPFRQGMLVEGDLVRLLRNTALARVALLGLGDKCLGLMAQGRVGVLVGGSGTSREPYRVSCQGVENWYYAGDLERLVSAEVKCAEERRPPSPPSPGNRSQAYEKWRFNRICGDTEDRYPDY